ncbi:MULTISPECIES: DUF4241 domain-containing protein [unclassified Inquilinus]|uniref:DUF4241 domain-containing protein n=1 Tax=unclassified Inquilinus TaxID=2645927 RepID=UPI003F926E6C
MTAGRLILALGILIGLCVPAAASPLPRSVVFARAFGPDFTVTAKDGATHLSGLEIGRLDVPSGRIVACDPFACDGAEAFTRSVPTGTFPVQLAMARLPAGDQRVAFARILFADRPALRWTMALHPGQHPKDLKPGYFFGYGVDTGTGAFMDASVQAPYLAETADSDLTADLVDVMNRAEAENRGGLLYATGPGNVAMISSGFGDGLYPSYFGLDKAGRVVALVTDFGVVEWRAGK